MDENRTDSRRVYELSCLELQLRRMSAPGFHSTKPLELDIYVSVNGDIPPNYLMELEDIERDNNITVFHRDNIGFQWGGFYDVWQRTKGQYDWYVTLEVDCVFLEHWFDKCSSTANNGYVGAPPLKRRHRLDYPKDWKLSKNQWHTNGAFDFCSNDLLKKIDKEFGCFTHATGSNHALDGILHGEIGFSQKVKNFTALKVVDAYNRVEYLNGVKGANTKTMHNSYWEKK